MHPFPFRSRLYKFAWTDGHANPAPSHAAKRLWHCVKLNFTTEGYFPPTVSRPVHACHAQLFPMSSDEPGVNECPLSVSLLMSRLRGRCIYFSSVHVKCKTANRPFVSVSKRKLHGAINKERLLGWQDAGHWKFATLFKRGTGDWGDVCDRNTSIIRTFQCFKHMYNINTEQHLAIENDSLTVCWKGSKKKRSECNVTSLYKTS